MPDRPHQQDLHAACAAPAPSPRDRTRAWPPSCAALQAQQPVNNSVSGTQSARLPPALSLHLHQIRITVADPHVCGAQPLAAQHAAWATPRAATATCTHICRVSSRRHQRPMRAIKVMTCFQVTEAFSCMLCSVSHAGAGAAAVYDQDVIWPQGQLHPRQAAIQRQHLRQHRRCWVPTLTRVAAMLQGLRAGRATRH